MAYTADDLDRAVRRRARLKSGSQGLAQSEILELADEEILTTCLPLLMAARNEYAIATEDYAITADQAEYRIPSRSVGAGVRTVKLVIDGTETPLDRVDLDDRGAYASATHAFGRGGCYTMQGDHIVLLPTPTQTLGTLRVRYMRRPNRLVPTTEAAQIAALPGGGLLGGGTPSGSSWSTSDLFDLIQGRPNFDLIGKDLVATSTGPVTLEDDYPTGLVVGDWVALAGETPLVQVPVELHPVLIAAVTVRVHAALGNTNQMTLAKAELEGTKNAIMVLIDPRDTGEEELVVNWHTPLRAGWGPR